MRAKPFTADQTKFIQDYPKEPLYLRTLAKMFNTYPQRIFNIRSNPRYLRAAQIPTQRWSKLPWSKEAVAASNKTRIQRACDRLNVPYKWWITLTKQERRRFAYNFSHPNRTRKGKNIPVPPGKHV